MVIVNKRTLWLVGIMARLKLGPPPGIGPSSQQQGPEAEVKKKPTTRKKTLPPLTTSKQQRADFLKANPRVTQADLKGKGGLQHQMQQRTADYYALQEKGIDPSWSAMDTLQFARDEAAKKGVGGPSKLARQFDTVYQDPSKSYLVEEQKGEEEQDFTKRTVDAVQKWDDFYKSQGWQGTDAHLTEEQLAHMSGMDVSDQRSIKPGGNPWRGKQRTFVYAKGHPKEGEDREYDPSLDGAPETMKEVRIAQYWVQVTKKLYKGIGERQAIDPETNELDPLGGTEFYRKALAPGQVATDKFGKEIKGSREALMGIPVSTQELAMLELIGDVEAEIDFVTQADREFRSESEKASIAAGYAEELQRLGQKFELQQQQVTTAGQWDRLKSENRARLAEIEVAHTAAVELANLQDQFDTGMLDQKSTLDIALQQNQQEYLGEQNRLDRAIQRQEYEEGARASQAVERLRQQEIDLQQQQFQLTLFMSLAQSPEILYFLNNMGALDMFGDIMGDGGQAINAIIGRVGEQQAGGDMGIGNIQQMGRLSSEEQAQQMYALSAQTGSRDPLAMLRGSAPMALTNPVDPNAPLLGGAPNLRVSNVGSTASTPLSFSREGGVPPQPPASSALPSSRVRVQGSGSMRPTKSMGDMEVIAKEYQEGRFTPLEGAAALEDIALSGPFTEDTFEMLVRLTMSMTNEPYSEAAQRIMRGPIGEWRHYGLSGRGM
jgi:hypothetical protein